MTRSFVAGLVTIALLLGGAGLVQASGGSSSTVDVAAPAQDPMQVAQQHYERGLKARDKAWEREDKLGAATEDKEVTKLKARIEKEYQRALRAYDSALELNPNLYQALSDKGYAHRRLGGYGESLAAYDKALGLSPGYTPAIEYRGEAYLGLDRVEEAKEAYMILFQHDRALADELLVAMKGWLEEKKADAGGVDEGQVNSFESWVNERAEIAQQMAQLSKAESRRW